jgi:aspartyl/asparaginyl-tRNA synthetase
VVCEKKEYPRAFEASINAPVGTYVSVSGHVKKSPGKEQKYEVLAQTFDVLTDMDAANYPLTTGKMTEAYLRQLPHLRMRMSFSFSFFSFM